MSMPYADSTVWDRRFEREGDLDWGGLWTDSFIALLRQSGCERVLDLGCGTGSDVTRLAAAGFRLSGLDFSGKAIAWARSKAIPGAEFTEADMAEALPYSDDHFDAVFSNVALHMFDTATTKDIVAEVKRVLTPGGHFIFHVNSLDDRELRAHRKRVLKELDQNRIQEEDGQTVRFFSKEELQSLFGSWATVQLEHLEIPHQVTGEPFKKVWRGVAIKRRTSQQPAAADLAGSAAEQ